MQPTCSKILEAVTVGNLINQGLFNLKLEFLTNTFERRST